MSLDSSWLSTPHFGALTKEVFSSSFASSMASVAEPQSFVREIEGWWQGTTMKPTVFYPLFAETKGSQSLGSPSSCPPANAQHIGRSRGHWRQEVLLMLMGVGKAPRSTGPESVSRRMRPGHMGQVRAVFFSGFCGSSPEGGREYLGEPTPRAKAERLEPLT